MPHLNCYWLRITAVILCLSSIVFAQEKAQSSDSSIEQSAIEKLASALIEAKSDEERNKMLAANKELVNAELQRVVGKSGIQLMGKGYEAQALPILQISQRIAEQIGYKEGLERALHNIGSIYRSQGKFDLALQYHQKSLAICEELGDKLSLAKSLIGIGNIYIAKYEYENALEYYQKSLKISEELKDKAGIALAAGNIGVIYKAQSDYENALKYCQSSLALSEELNDKRTVARNLGNIGDIFFFQSNYDAALENYKKSLAINEELGIKDESASVLMNIGIIYISQSYYEKAMDCFDKSLALYTEIENNEGIGYTLSLIADVYQVQGDYRKALAYQQKSLELGNEVNNKGIIATALNGIGTIYTLQNNYEQSLDYYRKALALAEETKIKPAIAALLNNIGEIYRRQGDLKQALDLFQKSLAIREEIGEREGVALSLNNVGEVYTSQEKYKQALEKFEQSLAISEELNNSSYISGVLNNISIVQRLIGKYEEAAKSAEKAAKTAKRINDLEKLWQSLLTLGAAYRALNKSDQAHKAFEESILTIETIRSQLAGGEQAGQTFFEDKIAPYHEMVDLLVSQNNFNEALSYAERAKARVILDILQSGRVDITKAMTPQEREQEKNLKNQMASLNKKLYAEKQQEKPDEARVADIETELNKSRLELEAFQTSLYAAHPELKVKRVEVQPITLDQARDLIPDSRTALLEFVVAENKTHLFVLTRTQQKIDLKIFTIDVNRKDLAERVGGFRDMIARKELGFRKPGRELYDLLLKPAEELLKGKTTLIVIPEGSLWELPFQVLQTPQNRYLLQDCALFYSPSLTALREAAKLKPAKRPAFSPALLAFGNPALKNQSGGSKEPALLDMKLDPLPAAEEQVRALAKLYGLKQSKFYIGAEAREERVKAEAGDYRVLQFATHGILNNASPMYSHLVLSQTEEKTDEDGLLEAREIADMDLQADMAVLAACETARGRVGAGEGVIGLTWALFVAGCPATVVSQWKVEDEATKELMLEFHRLLKSGAHNSRRQLSKAEALRAAALNMMRAGRDAHPFYWAGFVIVGNGR